MKKNKNKLEIKNFNIPVTSINKGLKLLRCTLDKKKDKSQLKLIKKIIKDERLYKWMNINTKRNKDNKITQYSIKKSLTLLENKIIKENNTSESKNLNNLKKEISKEECDKVYFTWENLIFTERGVKVDPNILYLSIKIDGPTSILSNLNVSYFQKKYSDELYKVYINRTTKKIVYKLSKDVKRIKVIVSNHLINNKTLQSKNSDLQKNLNKKNNHDYTIAKEIEREKISKHFQNNKFIEQSSKLLKNGNIAIALWENNNSTFEESIIIVLKHNAFNFIIWENINDNRACYVFKYRIQNFDTNMNKLKKFINSNIEFKRWDLFSNNGNKNELNYIEYYTVIHENKINYTKRLNTILHPYFKIQ